MELNGTITENRVDLGGTITAKKTLTGALAPTGGSAGPVVVTRGTGANSLIGVNTINPNTATGAEAIALGGSNQSTAPGAITIGTNNVASAQNAVAIGSKLAGVDPNTASAPAATALGLSCEASGYGSVATGYNTTSSGTGSTSMGYQTSATLDAALASGYLSTASGLASSAIGYQTTASGTAAAAIGREATASGYASTALGRGTTASAAQAFAAGRNTTAEATAATALGYGTDATGARSLVAGAYNAPDTNEVDTTHGSGARKYLMIIGNGTADNARSNASTLDWDGNAVFAGKATVGTAPTADMDVATKKYVDDHAGGGPSPATTAPAMDGTATAGTSTAYARADHVHPTDTSRAAASEITRIDAALATKADQASIQQTIEDAVDDWLTAQAPSIGTLSYAAKQALLACFRKVAWIDNQGQSYYNALESELFPDATLESITAVFTPEQAAPVTIDPTRIEAYITTDGRWLASSDAYSVCVPVTSGKRYKFQFTSTSSTNVGTIFRFGFSDTNTPTEQTLTGWVRSTPQDYVATEITASGSYLVIQLGASVASSIISNGYLALTKLGTVIYDTDSLNTLKQYLTVTATYSDSTTATVIDYTLSGALAVGTSTITASYGGKTDTFSVTVVNYWDISWDYTMGTPIGNGWKTGTSLPGVMESDGFKLSSTSSAGGEFAHDPNIDNTEGTFEAEITFSQIGSTYQGFCIFSPGMRLRIYSGKIWFNGSSTNTQASQTQIASISANTKYTIRWEYVKANFARVYVDGTLVHTQSSALADSTTRLFVNNTPSSSAVATIHAIRFREVS